jgi:hypothetical protein
VALQLAFGFVLVAAVLGSLISFFIPPGSALELAHAEHQPDERSSGLE